MTRKRLILEEGASRTHETCSKGAGAAIPARATLLHPQRIIMVSLRRYLQYRKASAGQLNERLEATLPPRKMAIAGNWSKESMVARGTVVGWAPQRDTGSARIRWWITAGSVLLGFAGVKRNPAQGSSHRVAPYHTGDQL